MGNEVVKFRTQEQKLMEVFVKGIETSLNNIGMNADDYQMACARNCFKKIYDLCSSKGVDINNIKDDVQTYLERASMLRLNALAIPSECYVILRDVDKAGKTPYLEFGIEGDGNDRLLKENGTDVETVYPYWLVRENDVFKYPSFKGIEITPPEWEPKDYTSKVVRVVYPVKYKTGIIQYHIAERESVKANLLAHISQNLMGEYFGITTFKKEGDAIKKVKEEQASKRKEIIDGVKDKTLEEILSDPSVQPYMSPSWRNPHSQESMIIRKLRNNVTKPIPKDLKNAYVYQAYRDSVDEDATYEEKVDPRINKEDALEAEIVDKVASEKIDSPTQPTTGTGESPKTSAAPF